MIEQEIWKDIKDYEGLYQISSFGRYRSCDRYIIYNNNRWGGTSKVFLYGKIMKHSKNNSGYCTICLHKDNKPKTFLLHRVVAQAFIPNPNNLPEVNHKDENKENNNVDNLQWCTRVFNNNYGKLNKDGRRKSRKHRMKKVAQYTIDGKLIATYDGLRVAKEQTGINNLGIARCCEGILKTSGGYVWKYVTKEDCCEVIMK